MVIRRALLRLVPRRRNETLAIVVRAEKRPPARHAKTRRRLKNISAACRPAWVSCRADAIIVRLIPFAAPFPDFARHVEQSIAVRRIGADRRRAMVAVFLGVLVR